MDDVINESLILSHIGDYADSVQSLSKELIKTEINVIKNTSSMIGTKYSSPITFKFTLVKESGDSFSLDERRKLLRWLGSKEYKRLDFISDENPSGWYYIGSFTQIDLRRAGSMGTVGIICTFENNSSFAYLSHSITYKDVTNNMIKTLYCDNDIDGYLYPEIKVKSNQTGNISILNQTDNNRTISFKCNKLDQIIINSETCKISSTSNTFDFSDFSSNIYFIRLLKGENTLKFILDGSVDFAIEYTTKIMGGVMDEFTA